MSNLKHLYSQLRRLSTCRIHYRPTLGTDYRSKNLWEDRFNCDLLGNDQNIIKTINTKILSGVELNNLEVDVFINIAASRQGETAQLSEAARTLAQFRRSLSAHTLLPSTSHAVCRLFLDSGRIESLVRLLEKRVEYGVFPDPFILNILFDSALEKDNLALASRLASLIMLQEEFGMNDLNDNFALYSVSRYIESLTDFNDWIESVQTPDPILEPEKYEQHQVDSKEKENNMDKVGGDEEDDEEDEEDAEYIRIPFLRNAWHDKHFDLTNPREICGKTLLMLGRHLDGRLKETNLGARCMFLGNILQANWLEAIKSLSTCKQSKVPFDQSFREAARFYLENLHQLEGPDETDKKSILKGLEESPQAQLSISQEAEQRHAKLRDLEQTGIEELRRDIQLWSEIRHRTKRARDSFEERQKLIAEIKAKKEELKEREQYLYFYDDLKRRNLTRIEYD
jgi:small subunit ribosomal protein S27